MASQRDVLFLIFLLLIVNNQFSRAQHWSHGWYPGGKRELGLSQSPEVSEEIKLCRGDGCLSLGSPRKDVIRSIVEKLQVVIHRIPTVQKEAIWSFESALSL
ncbi:progonadoliberin-2 isoform X1 [Scyliorhinus torazame]|uniref:progonadoliberin-2 isoform X1 n=1 Tax=Scyliorhinus torazame TaxID=75743 RepID=UPI003B5C4B23